MLRRIAWSALLVALLGPVMPAEGLERVYAQFPICNETESPTILSELKAGW
jgi:hypothetical protein